MGINPELVRKFRREEEKKKMEELRERIEKALSDLEKLEDAEESLRQELRDIYGAQESSLREKRERIEILEGKITKIREDARKLIGGLQNIAIEELRGFRERFHGLQERYASAIKRLEIIESPPLYFAAYIRANDDGSLDVNFRGDPTRVVVDPEAGIDPLLLKPGQRLLLSSQTMAVIVVLDEFEEVGEEAIIDNLLEGDAQHVRVVTQLDHKRVVALAKGFSKSEFDMGDNVLIDRYGYIVKRLPQSEVEELTIEEAPNVTFDDIGGLDTQKQDFQEELFYPLLYPEVDKQLELGFPKGVLISGPPGNGKTMLAKAALNELSRLLKEKLGTEKAKGYMIVVGGPAIQHWYVGATEFKLRNLFSVAQKKATPETPVFIVFDEAESLFPTRGSGISSDVEKTTVPQFTTLVDGIEENSNIIVLLITNRPDLIDPAVTRDGRIDRKIHVPRPDEAAAFTIFLKYLKSVQGWYHPKYFVDDTYIPTDRNGKPRRDDSGNTITYDFKRDPQNVARYLAGEAVRRMYGTNTPRGESNEFLMVEYDDGTEDQFAYGDFASGAMIANIVNRAKKKARHAHIASKSKVPLGLELVHLIEAIQDEFQELKNDPNFTNPDEWFNIAVKHGKRVRRISLASDREDRPRIRRPYA